MPAKCSDADFENAVNAYVAGESAEDAARRFHTTGARLSAELKARGLFRDEAARVAILRQRMLERSPNRIDLPNAEIAKLYLADTSENAIARQFGVSRNVITRCLREAHVERRTMTEANRLLAEQTPITEHHRRIAIAQEASRGMHHTLEHRCKAAATRQLRQTHVSQAELALQAWLEVRGVTVVPQQAIGPYNVDLGAFPVAVEVFGGSWHFGRNHAERFNYLFDRGWHVVVVFVDHRRSILTEGAADYIVSFLQETTGNPAGGRQYRVIWGEGKLYAAGGPDGDELSNVVPRRGRHGRGPRR